MENSKTGFVKDWWKDLTPQMKMLIIVIIVIIVIVIVGKVKTSIDNYQMNKYSERAPVDGSGFRDPRALIDSIYTNLNGANLYVYPEIVNKLVNLSDSELTAANDYWNSEYATITGKSLYGFIDGEWDGGHYAPALEKLERKGLTA